MRVHVTYGHDGLDLDLPDDTYVVEPSDAPGLPDEAAAFRAAVRDPIGAPALRDLVAAHERVVIVTSDITRATPNERLIPWILDELGHVPPENITVIIGTGSHRATKPEEMERMFGRAVLDRVRIVDHDAHDPTQVTYLGKTSRGARAYLNLDYVNADKRIVVGFIEPHLYAGFSGGSKGIMPGIAGIETVKFFHNFQMVGSPGSTWLNLEGNPIQEMSREVAGMAPPHFMVNVTLNGKKAITGLFCGDYRQAHLVGSDFCKKTGATPVPKRFDVVVTTNGGYPLDQNLYQGDVGRRRDHETKRDDRNVRRAERRPSRSWELQGNRARPVLTRGALGDDRCAGIFGLRSVGRPESGDGVAARPNLIALIGT
jgi:nickel-dependent lactate racemase